MEMNQLADLKDSHSNLAVDQAEAGQDFTSQVAVEAGE